MSKQSRDSQAGGAQLVGKAPSAPRRAPPKFLGKSGTPDNQTTSRGKGKN
jgi:hypothetical protein